jgi:hypothetical protein
MKRIFLLLSIVTMAFISSCEGPPGPPGVPGYSAESEVFELQNINFIYDHANGYIIYQTLTPKILDSDVILIYRLSGTIDSQTPIWQLIPRTLYLEEGELDYDFDFSKEDFTIYAGGTYNLAFTPSYIQQQTFRIVIIPGYFSGKSANNVDRNDYNAVINAYNIDDTNVKVLNKK